MRIKWMQLLVLGVIMSALPGLALAKEVPDLDLKLSVEKKVVLSNAEGETRTEWREVRNLKPGDMLKYTITYTNTSTTEAQDAVIVDSVPFRAEYVNNSAAGKNTEITFSLDGKVFQPPALLKYKVTPPGTPEQEFSATPEMYTHIRWQITKPVPTGGTGKVSFKVILK
jgi:uncharacterized repeat protein (TIGR01451 family)